MAANERNGDAVAALKEILETPQPEILRRKDLGMIGKMCEEMLTEAMSSD